MKPIRSIKNQYPGINAHLHSYWQAEGEWSSFHTRHIVHLADTLMAQLRPMGYITKLETSLQIRRIDDSSGKPKADVLISDLNQQGHFQSSAMMATVQTIPFAALLDEDELSETPFWAVGIYPFQPGNKQADEPVAWIELLSPSNKGDSGDAQAYQRKRLDLLINGLVFLEIDYLHESSPTFRTIFDYSRGHPQAHPYRIIVIDPRPILEKGPTQVVPFDVDQPLPIARIPLNGGDFLDFDFGLPYRKTLEEGYYGDFVDYTQFPGNFERYGPADQARIAARMMTILEKAQQGIDLETGPFAVNPITLEEALARIAALNNA
jgi:Protein of unknown function (DUF4058)